MKQRQKFVRELCIGRSKTECIWQARESHETVINSSQDTSTITCTATPRVWHFNAFHYLCDSVKQIKESKKSAVDMNEYLKLRPEALSLITSKFQLFTFLCFCIIPWNILHHVPLLLLLLFFFCCCYRVLSTLLVHSSQILHLGFTINVCLFSLL